MVSGTINMCTKALNNVFASVLYEEYAALRDHKRFELHAAGSPLLEVNYVTIHPEETLDEDEFLEVYGIVQVTNGNGEKRYLYNQPEDDAETMGSGDRLFLIDTKPISSPFPVTTIHIHLMDKTKGLELAKGDLTLDYKEREICFEESDSKFVEGSDGCVNVSYTTFESAVVTRFELELHNENYPRESGSHYAPIVGDISISYDCKYNLSRHLHTQILWADSNDHIEIECGIQLPLRKTSVALPGYSSLKIEARLGDIVIGNAIIPPFSCGWFKDKIEGYNGYYIIVYGKRELGNPERVLIQPRNKVIAVDCPSDLHIFRLPCTWEYEAEMLTEVFSIVIYPDEKLNADEVINLYGTIFCYSVSDDVFLFKRDEDNPVSFLRGKCNILTTDGPHRRCIGGFSPMVKMELKDVKGHVFCKGVIPWDGQSLYRDDGVSWHDKRLCSIIRGDFGLVKVYYSMFFGALQAAVKISFSFDHTTTRNIDISGSIIASYNKYDYTLYENKYYRSVLFLKSEKSTIGLSVGRKIPLPLIKSAICVPKDSLLVIEVDLCMSFMDEGPCVETLKGLGKFEVGRDSWWRLRNDSFFVDVSVDWTNVVHHGRRKE